LNELKFQRITLDNIIKLGEEVRQGYSREGQNTIDLQMTGLCLFSTSLFKQKHLIFEIRSAKEIEFLGRINSRT